MEIAIPTGPPVVMPAQPTSRGQVVSNLPNTEVVEYVGESLILNPAAMTGDRFYKVHYRGKPAVAFKRADGTIVLCKLPDK
jgi:hypothetical protein